MHVHAVRRATPRLVCAAFLPFVVALAATAGTAAAQTMPKLGPPVAMTGKDRSGKTFTGVFSPQRFIVRRGQMFAVGSLRGRLNGRSVVRRNVRMPAALGPATATARAAQQTPPIPPTPNACQILSLVLGPLDLNLLGLRIRLNQVRLLIEAVPSGGNTGGQPGGLLGDLLCGIANLLAPQSGRSLDQSARLLNAWTALAGSAPR